MKSMHRPLYTIFAISCESVIISKERKKTKELFTDKPTGLMDCIYRENVSSSPHCSLVGEIPKPVGNPFQINSLPQNIEIFGFM